jgi:hypothetical protein
VLTRILALTFHGLWNLRVQEDQGEQAPAPVLSVAIRMLLWNASTISLVMCAPPPYRASCMRAETSAASYTFYLFTTAVASMSSRWCRPPVSGLGNCWGRVLMVCSTSARGRSVWDAHGKHRSVQACDRRLRRLVGHSARMGGSVYGGPAAEVAVPLNLLGACTHETLLAYLICVFMCRVALFMLYLTCDARCKGPVAK